MGPCLKRDMGHDIGMKHWIIVQANPVYLAVCEVWYIDTYPQMV